MTKYLGVGVGMRRKHFKKILQANKFPDWFEIISENYMNYGGRPELVLDHARSHVPVIPHGVGLSLGSVDEFKEDYIELLAKLVKKLDAPWFSDHLCFSSFNRHHYHDLIPLLRTQESLELITHKIKLLSERIQRPFAFENISYYLETDHHEMDELTFTLKLLEMSDSYMLLDINNVFVNSVNLGGDPWDYLKAIPQKRVIQIHLAGHWNRGDKLIDNHGSSVTPEVWDLYERFLKHAGRPISTLIEWDHNIPTYDELLSEADKARAIIQRLFPREASCEA